ncbi:hypothetical protein ABIE67_001195 [Streptomyces sp. V4I8]|uniref:hypothetical protein n=1 Tax=Streptomyces sp. V4I8 TaxID=3156469 RepID=UPI003516E9C1
MNHSGNGKTNEFGTHATDSGGIKGARIQVAVLEGGSVLGSCDTPYTTNPRS